jgi:uncharacterized protein YbcI
VRAVDPSYQRPLLAPRATLNSKLVARLALGLSSSRAAHLGEAAKEPAMASSDAPQHAAGAHPCSSLRASLSDVVVRITAEYTGRGPTRASTILNGDWVVVTLTDTLTKGERKLAENGRGTFVREARRAYQDAMRSELVAEVEALTQRRVTAFLSDNHIEPDVAIEAFQLAPESD